MRLALRDLDTGMFYVAGGYWTDDPWYALEFDTPADVHAIAAKLKIDNPELIFLSDCPPVVSGGASLKKREFKRVGEDVNAARPSRDPTTR